MIVDEIAEGIDPETLPFFQSVLDKAVILRVQNVADYYYENPKDLYTYGDFPNVSPPWPKIWMEWARPKSWLTDTEPHGAILEYSTVKKITPGLWQISSPLSSDRVGCSLEYFEAPWIKELGCRWMIQAAVYSIHLPGAIILCQYFFVYESGEFAPIPSSDSRARRIIGDNLGLDGDLLGEGRILFPRILSPAFNGSMSAGLPLPDSSMFDVPFLALTFCHCKNVVAEKTIVDEPLRKKRVKKDKMPIDKFYTLNIQPMKEVLKHEGHSDTQGISKAMHFCRGHFADYREGSGLFGKYHGRYFIPLHKKGSAARGRVTKTYNVEPKGGSHEQNA